MSALMRLGQDSKDERLIFFERADGDQVASQFRQGLTALSWMKLITVCGNAFNEGNRSFTTFCIKPDTKISLSTRGSVFDSFF
jgi:hypothetical protein